MTVLGLILGIEVAGLAFALFAARVLARGGGDSTALRRLAGALARAARAFLLRQGRQVGVVAAATLLALLALYAVGGSRSGAPVEAGFWVSLSFVAGCVGAMLVALTTAALGIRAGVAVVTTAPRSLDRALSCALRAGTASGLMSEALSVLGPLTIFGLAFAVKGGFTLELEAARTLARELSIVLPPFALGAVVAALVLQRGGGAYHACSDVGGDLAGESDAGLEHDDPRNPAMVSDVVGDQLGMTTRAADAFATSSALTVACAILALRSSGELVALGLFPLLVRSFGVIACATGVLVVRTEEAKHPNIAIARGHLSACVVLFAGISAAGNALLGANFWLAVAAGLLGPLAGSAAAYSGLRLARRQGPLKQALETLRIGGGGVTVAASIGAGLQAALLPIAVIAGSACAAFWLGQASGLAAGAELGLLTWLSALAALLPYAVAVASFGAVADSARSMAESADLELDARRRLARLDDAGFAAASLSHAYATILSTLSALGIGLALFALIARPDGAASTLSSPLPIACGALGAALVLAYAGSAARGAARGAREVALEVERQLRGFPREQGVALIPADYTPSYKSCEELTAKNALSGVLASAAYLLVPLLLGAALRFMYRASSPWLLADGLTAFVVVAAVTGFGAALVVDGARTALGGARRATRPRGATPGFTASVTGDAVADILGNVAGPAAHLMGKAGAVLLLALAPFLL